LVSSKTLPGDFDVCYDTTGIDPERLDLVLLRFENQRAAQKAKFLGEFFPAHIPATPLPQPAYLEFFQLVKYSDRKKGILALDLRRSL
jgi:hypothetical protein